jgi:hypothetical protein
MQPAFHRERIAGYGRLMVGCAQQHVGDWRSGDVKDIQQEMHVNPADRRQDTLRRDLTCDARAVGAAFATALESMQARISGLQLLLPDSVPTRRPSSACAAPCAALMRWCTASSPNGGQATTIEVTCCRSCFRREMPTMAQA